MSYYEKSSGKKELRQVKQSNLENVVENTHNINFNVSEGYQKKEGNLDPSLFIIVSGGEKREKDYFYFFKNRSESFPRIIIEFITEDDRGIGGLDIDKLVKVALKIKTEKEKSKSNDILDSINVVTDVDDFYTQIKGNLKKCESNNINLIISNPCFEIWLYYSYYKCMPNDFKIPKNKLKISSDFKTYLGGKHKGGIDPRKAPLELETAIKNSQNNFNLDKNNIPELFSTQMHIVATKLYDLTAEGISIEKKILEKKRINYKIT